MCFELQSSLCLSGWRGVCILVPSTDTQVPYIKRHGTAGPQHPRFPHPQIQPTVEAKFADMEGRLYMRFSVVFFFSLVVIADFLC